MNRFSTNMNTGTAGMTPLEAEQVVRLHFDRVRAHEGLTTPPSQVQELAEVLGISQVEVLNLLDEVRMRPLKPVKAPLNRRIALLAILACVAWGVLLIAILSMVALRGRQSVPEPVLMYPDVVAPVATDMVAPMPQAIASYGRERGFTLEFGENMSEFGYLDIAPNTLRSTTAELIYQRVIDLSLKNPTLETGFHQVNLVSHHPEIPDKRITISLPRTGDVNLRQTEWIRRIEEALIELEKQNK